MIAALYFFISTVMAALWCMGFLAFFHLWRHQWWLVVPFGVLAGALIGLRIARMPQFPPTPPPREIALRSYVTSYLFLVATMVFFLAGVDVNLGRPVDRSKDVMMGLFLPAGFVVLAVVNRSLDSRAESEQKTKESPDR